MLILTVKTDGEIKIGENVTIKILSIERGQVRMGIEAPKDIMVHREEIYNRIQSELREEQEESEEKEGVSGDKKEDKEKYNEGGI